MDNHGQAARRPSSTNEIDHLAQITDRFLYFCLDNPKENALSVFEKVAK
jgi:hypothetical protein